jgi:hypothetical protein
VPPPPEGAPFAEATTARTTDATPLHVTLIQASSASSASSPASANVLPNVTKLLQHDPGMARAREASGRSPLHAALGLLGSHPSVHPVALKLAQADPDSVAHRDPATGLYPFQMAASGLSGADVVDVEVVYRLLRTQPSVLATSNGSRTMTAAGATAANRTTDTGRATNETGDVRAGGKINGTNLSAIDPVKVHADPSREPTVRSVSLVADAFPGANAATGPEMCAAEREEPPGPSSATATPAVEDPRPEPSVTGDSLIVGSYPDSARGAGLDEESSSGAEDPDEATCVAASTGSMPSNDFYPSATPSPAPPSSPPAQRRGSVSLGDFLLASSPRSPRRPGVRAASSTDAAPPPIADSEARSCDSTAAGGLALSTDDEEDEYEYSDYECEEGEEEGDDDGENLGNASAEEGDDPIVRSINGMCSGALLLLTTMFHNNP